jgi:uncharacterized protein
MNIAVTPETRIGNFMHTFRGGKYWPFDPRVEEVFIEDIAHSLATKCRYAGHCKGFYSVAEHSVYCSYIGPPDEALERLMHDGAETYNGDLIRPLKRDPEFAAPFHKVETINELIIAQKFKLTYPYPPSVKIADEMVTSAEIEQIIAQDPNLDFSHKLHDHSAVANIKIRGLSWELAEAEFLGRFMQLWIERA